jgi:16S rRNA (cytosine967-C5)-methyltransferase
MSAPRDARALALSVLLEVHQKGAYANLALPEALAKFSGQERDKALATEIVYGSLRRQGELDVVLAEVSHRGLDEMDPVILSILRISVYQLLFLRIPDHAAVDQGVRLAKDQGFFQAAGFVNALLRRIVAKPVTHWHDVISQAPDIDHSHPRWIAHELEEAWNQQDDRGEFSEVLKAHNESPLVTLACLPGLSEPGPKDHRTPWSPVGVVLERGNPLGDPRVAQGLARVQDEGSQLAALLLSRYKPFRKGETVLDMCAGPGGKTALIGADAALAGATVVAVEKVPHRARLVGKSVEALTQAHPGVVEVSVADATSVTGVFDRILLDAPCSGLGALRRRPEARWTKSPEQLDDLVALQKALLTHAVSLLAPGGVLAYVTCSPVLQETTEVVEAVLAATPDITPIDTPEALDALARVVVPRTRRGKAVQLWTHLHGTDAMFIQLLTKTSKG